MILERAALGIRATNQREQRGRVQGRLPPLIWARCCLASFADNGDIFGGGWCERAEYLLGPCWARTRLRTCFSWIVEDVDQ